MRGLEGIVNGLDDVAMVGHHDKFRDLFKQVCDVGQTCR